MLVRDLAKELNITEEVILSTLKGLKLRAKGEAQELSPAVLIVLKGELENKGIIAKEEEKKPVAKKPAKKPAKEGEKPARKKKEKAAQLEAETSAVKEEEKIKEAAKPAETVREETPVKKPPEPAKPVVQQEKAPAKLPDELAQFERPSAENVEAPKPVVKKVIKKVVTKKKVQPEFITMKPLAHGRRKPGERDGVKPAHVEPASAAEASTTTVEAPAVHKHEGPLRDLEVKVPLTVGDFAFHIQEKTNVVLKTLMNMGIFANINQNLGEDIVRKLCEQFGFNLVEVKSQEEQLVFEHEQEQDDPKLLKARAPVVTFMGHVDHGKTSLLDRIRKTKVVDSEHGGITQHIGAYSVILDKGRITFLDTPGHAAFTAMRARGAHITDLVVLVVAADEGIMPQTMEAVDHARAAKVPIVVALNKIDRPNADADKVKKQLMEHDLMPEDWGGKTVVVPVSAHTGQGIDTLLEMILLESEILELKSNPVKKAAGIVVEAHLSAGKGALATLIVQSGTLKEGDLAVVGPYYGKIKAMFDDRARHLKEAGPSMPVEILGLPAVPDAGEKFFVVENEKTAREITAARQEKLKAERLRASSKITLEDLFAQKAAGEVRELNIVLKADVQGSLEALKGALEKIPSENKEVVVKFIHCGVGEVNSSDVILAVVSKAIIIAFNVGTNADANDEQQKTPVDIRRYTIIYDVVNDVKAALEGLLKPDTKRLFIARAEIRQVFKLSKSGIVAGCFVLKGRMRQKLDVEIMRNNEVVHTGKITTLKRFKDDVREVGEGYECGIAVGGYEGYQQGDIIEAFQVEQIARKL